MATPRGKLLAQDIRQKVAALKQACQGVDENLAVRAPQGRWSPKQILSHLCGPEGAGHLPILRAFVDRDTPMLDLDAENPFFTENRARMSLIELIAECERNYQDVANFAEELTEEQMGRKARIPMLKDSPLGEYPTLEGMIHGLGEYHLQFHIDHLGEILAALSSERCWSFQPPRLQYNANGYAVTAISIIERKRPWPTRYATLPTDTACPAKGEPHR